MFEHKMHPGNNDIATATLELGPLTANARGGKNASVTVNGKPIRLSLKIAPHPLSARGTVEEIAGVWTSGLTTSYKPLRPNSTNES